MIDKDRGFNMLELYNETILINVYDSLTLQPHNLTWNATDFKDRALFFKVSFEKPLSVSKNLVQTNRRDIINVQINKSDIFTSRENPANRLNKEDLSRNATVSKQLINEGFSLIFPSRLSLLEDSQEGITFSTFGINFLIAASLSGVMQAFNVMQLFAYLTLMNLEYPANAQMFSKANLKFVSLDIIDPVAV